MRGYILLVLLIVLFCVQDLFAQAVKTPSAVATTSIVGDGFDKLPTFIKSDSLTLKSEERTFEYLGNVEVKQGDMTLTAESVVGKYTQDNKIETITANRNVLVLKGENIRATGDVGVYQAEGAIVTLTGNPELLQGGSVLTADVIKIYLNENRSLAEGAVRVKVVKTPGADGQKSEGPLSNLR
jgi:lipopolysaccharide export system protein LptA